MLAQHGIGSEIRENQQITRLNSVYGAAEPSTMHKNVSTHGSGGKGGAKKASAKSPDAEKIQLKNAADDEVSALAREEKALLERLANVRAKKADSENRGRSLWSLAQQRMRKVRGKPQRVSPSCIQVRVRLQAHLGADDVVSIGVGVHATSQAVAPS